MAAEIRELAVSLASVDERARERAFQRLEEALPSAEVADFKRLCIGLHYFYWYCDGPSQQAKAVKQIAKLELRARDVVGWRRALIDVLVKFCDRIDYHRVNKYFNLYREVFGWIYNSVLEEGKAALLAWNEYFSNAIVWRRQAKPVLLELIYACEQELLPSNRPAHLLFLFCKPFIDLFCFTSDKVLRQAVAAHLFPALTAKAAATGKSEKVAAYLKAYLVSDELCEKTRTAISALANELENSESPVAEETLPTKPITQTTDNKEESAAMNAESEMALPGEEEYFLNEYEEETEVIGNELDEFFEGEDGNAMEGLQESAAFDPQAFPPYYFKTRKQKIKFFRQMNNKYFSAMRTGGSKKIKKESPSVQFNLGQTQIRKFHKNQILAL